MDLYNKDPLAEQQLLQANQLSETLIFEQCRINKDPKDFRKYVARFTENPPVPENLVTVKNWLRFHDINQAKKQDSLITYSTFLSNYLNDENAKDDLKWVRKRVRELQFASARKSATRSSYQNFVLKHRNDREAAEMVSFANREIIRLDYEKAESNSTRKSYDCLLYTSPSPRDIS